MFESLLGRTSIQGRLFNATAHEVLSAAPYAGDAAFKSATEFFAVNGEQRHVRPDASSACTQYMLKLVYGVAKAGDTLRQSDTSKRDLACVTPCSGLSTITISSCLAAALTEVLRLLAPLPTMQHELALQHPPSHQATRPDLSAVSQCLVHIAGRPGHPIARSSRDDTPASGARGGGEASSFHAPPLRWPHLA